MYIGILDGKVYDICSNLRHKRDNNIDDKDYLEIEKKDIYIDDTWENNTSLKDSHFRTDPMPDNMKSKLELKLEELELKIKKLEEL